MLFGHFSDWGEALDAFLPELCQQGIQSLPRQGDEQSAGCLGIGKQQLLVQLYTSGKGDLGADEFENIEAAKAKRGSVRGKSPILDEAIENAEGMHPRSAPAGMTERVAERRKAVGSQVVARELGMTKEQVRSDAGTILDEALGAASDVIPADRWAEIARKKLPAYRDQRGWLFVSEDTISKFKSRREKRFVPA